jgi:hypothetical protein
MSARIYVQRDGEQGFTSVPHSLARCNLEAGVVKLLLFLASHVDGWIVHNTEAAQVLGVSVNSYKKHLATAEAKGYVRRTPTGERDRHGKELCNLVVSLSAGLTDVSGLSGRPHPALSENDSAHCQKVTTKKNNQEDQQKSSSNIAGAIRGDDQGSPLEPLPSSWKPNGSHAASVKKYQDASYRLLPLDELADDFRDRVLHRKSRNWNGAFGAFIKAYAEDEDEKLFPVPYDDEVDA